MVVNQIVKDISRCGFNDKIILKGDQEPAVEDSLREIARARKGQETIVEFSPTRDSQSNVPAEPGHKREGGLKREVVHRSEASTEECCEGTLSVRDAGEPYEGQNGTA